MDEKNIAERPPDPGAENEDSFAQDRGAAPKKPSEDHSAQGEEFIEWRLEEVVEKKIAEAIPKIVEGIQKKLQEELPKAIPQKKEESDENLRKKYTDKIWGYFPGAKTKDLSTEELKSIVEQLDKLAAKVQYKPILPRRMIARFWGEKPDRGKMIIIFAVSAFLAALTYRILVGW